MTRKNKRGGGRKKPAAKDVDLPDDALHLTLACTRLVQPLPSSIGGCDQEQQQAQTTVDGVASNGGDMDEDDVPGLTYGIQLVGWPQLGPLLSWYQQQVAGDARSLLTFSPQLPKDLRAQVHNTVSGMKGLCTLSQGVGEERCVVVLAQGAAPRRLIPAAIKDGGVALWRLAVASGWGPRYSRDEVVAMMEQGQLTEELQELWEGPEGRQQQLLRELCLAASAGDAVAVSSLLSAHSQLLEGSVQDLSSGGLPLHLAAAGGWEEVVRLLLAAGADVAALDGAGRTALQVAQAAEECTVEALLLQAGAVDTQQDNWQQLMGPAAAATAGNGDLPAPQQQQQSCGSQKGPAAAELQQVELLGQEEEELLQQQGELPAEWAAGEVEGLPEGEQLGEGEEDEEEEGKEDPVVAAALADLLTITRLVPRQAPTAAAPAPAPAAVAAAAPAPAAHPAAGSAATTAAGAAAATTSNAPTAAAAGAQQAMSWGDGNGTTGAAAAAAGASTPAQVGVEGEEVLLEHHGEEPLGTGDPLEEEGQEEEGSGEADPQLAAALADLLTVTRLTVHPGEAAAPAPAAPALQAAAAAAAAAAVAPPSTAAAAAGQEAVAAQGLQQARPPAPPPCVGAGGGADAPVDGAEGTAAAAAGQGASSCRSAGAARGDAGSSSAAATATSDAAVSTDAAASKSSCDGDTAITSSQGPLGQVYEQVLQHPVTQRLGQVVNETWSTTCDQLSTTSSWLQQQLPPGLQQQLQQLTGGQGEAQGAGGAVPPAVVWGGVAVAGVLAVGGILAMSSGARRRRAVRRR